MATPPLHQLTVTQAAASLRRGEFSAEELTRACLEQVTAHEPAIHAFITFAPEEALAQSHRADQQFAAWRKNARQGTQPPALLGIPIVVKDVLALEGLRLTCGSRILENFVPPFTATAVQRLLDAGVVVLGKTNTDEFAMGSSTENSAYGVTHNPWNLDRVPGGSSGGSAAAVAAGFSLAGLGTDTGGSVRQPASFCGVVGLKPTYGRVSRYGLVAYGSSLDCVGVFSRSIPDAELIFRSMAGPDPLDATSMDLPVSPLNWSIEPNLNGLRVGVPAEFFIEGMQGEVEQAVKAAIEVLVSLGAQAVPIHLPHTEFALPVYYLLAPAEASANLARYDGIRYGPRAEAQSLAELISGTRGQLFGAEVKRRIMLGTYALSAGYYEAYYGQAQKVRTLIKQDYDQAFSSVDVIAAPVAPTTAFPIGGHGDDPLSMYLEDVFTLPANLAGVPGLSFPVGFDAAGLPVGMQLMGPHYREDLLFHAAHAYQLATDWHTRFPKLPF